MAISPLLIALLPVALFVYTYTRSAGKKQNYPDGPKPLPLLGNALQLAKEPQLWLTVHEWAKKYGTITYTHVLGMSLVFLNTPEAALDLLEKKGSIYSDKPGLVMAGELCGCENMVAFTRYGDQSRRQRKLMTRALSVQAVKNYEPLIAAETHAFLRRLIHTPNDYVAHIKRYSGQLTLSTVYGYRVNSNDDAFLTLANECVDLLSQKIASGGGIWPVDVIPALKHLPHWAPGAGFLRSAKIWKAKMEEFVDRPYAWMKAEISKGSAAPSFCSTLLSDPVDEKQEFDIKWTANSMYSASIDTTLTTILFMVLALTLNPEILHRAQEEIDSVTKGERLPTFADRPNLPYVEAVMLETLRWGCPVPLALPHRLMEDDVYEGKFIPAGSLVFANVWNMMRDPSVFPSPESFNPERYFNLSSRVSTETYKRMDPRNFVFGFGRRGCPGQHLFDSSGWFLMASMLATLEIGKKVSANGSRVEPKVEFNGGVFRMPKEFECDIRPRSQRAVDLLAETELL